VKLGINGIACDSGLLSEFNGSDTNEEIKKGLKRLLLYISLWMPTWREGLLNAKREP